MLTKTLHIATDTNNNYESMFKRYYSALCYFAERYVGQEFAEDVVEDVFLKLWEKEAQFTSEQQCKAYLYSAVKNRCIDTLRANKSSEANNQRFYSELADANDDYLWQITRTEVVRQLHQAIAQLPPQASKIIKLTYLEGMSNQQVADYLGLSLQTVKNQKLRGLALLKKKMPSGDYQLLLALPSLFYLLK